MVAWFRIVVVSCGLLAACGDHGSTAFDASPGGPTPDAPKDCPLCALWSIDRPIARAGEFLWLEGNFLTNVGGVGVVTFPGGINTLGQESQHRTMVAVPATATAGMLTFGFDGRLFGAARFRRAEFELGLQAFSGSYDQAGGAQELPSLLHARSRAASVVHGDWLYVIGGLGAGSLTSVERARIRPDGTLGPFTDSSSLTTPRASALAVVVGSTLYVIGGDNQGHASASVERARIADDGSLGAFEIAAGTTLAHPRTAAAGVIVGERFYVVGGHDDGGALATVELASLGLPDLLSTFVETAPLLAARSAPALVVIGGALYIIGGSDGTGAPLASLERAAIDGDGKLSAFAPVTNQLAVAREASRSTFVLGHDVYVVGGRGATGSLASVERAHIGAGDSLEPFGVVPGLALDTPRATPTTMLAGNHAYVIAGEPGLATLERASIDGSGNIGAPTLAASSIVDARDAYTLAATHGFVYASGGDTNGGDDTLVERAALRADGTFGSFTIQSTSGLVTPRQAHGGAIAGGFVYELGGFDGTGTTDLASVERAAIQPDGSLAPSETQIGVNLATARASASTVILGRFLYLIGGRNHTVDALATLERAPIAADGTLGTFATVPGVTLAVPRADHASVVLGTWLYVIGGADASIERAPVHPDGTLGTFAVVGTLVTPRRNAAIVVAGSQLYVLGGRNASGILPTIEAAPIGLDGTLGSFATSSTSLMTARFAHSAYVVGNTAYVLGGLGDAGRLHAIEQLTLE